MSIVDDDPPRPVGWSLRTRLLAVISMAGVIAVGVPLLRDDQPERRDPDVRIVAPANDAEFTLLIPKTIPPELDVATNRVLGLSNPRSLLAASGMHSVESGDRVRVLGPYKHPKGAAHWVLVEVIEGVANGAVGAIDTSELIMP